MKILVDEMPACKDDCIFGDMLWEDDKWKNYCQLGFGGVSECDLENDKCSKLHSSRLKLATTTPYENVGGR